MQQGSQNGGRICPRGASYYIWQAGDTLSSVAFNNQTTMSAIEILNPDINFQTLSAGTEICMPSRAQTCISGQPYTVNAGDTFDAIAQRLGVDTLELRERNPGVSATSLMPGQIICVPLQTDGSTSNGTPNGNGATNGGPVLDGTGMDDNTVTPQQPTTPVRPGLSCPVGYTAQRVQAGQTYADLLIDLNVSYKAMRAANPTLRPGFMIAGTAYCAPPAGTRETCSTTRSYTIQPEETLTSLAEKLGTTRGRLLMLNPTLVPTDFSSGTVICIP